MIRNEIKMQDKDHCRAEAVHLLWLVVMCWVGGKGSAQ